MKRYTNRIPSHIRNALEHEGSMNSDGKYLRKHLELETEPDSRAVLSGSLRLVRSRLRMDHYYIDAAIIWAVVLGYWKIFWRLINMDRRAEHILHVLRILIEYGRPNWLEVVINRMISIHRLTWGEKEDLIAFALYMCDREALICLMERSIPINLRGVEKARGMVHELGANDLSIHIEMKRMLRELQRDYPTMVRIIL